MALLVFEDCYLDIDNNKIKIPEGNELISKIEKGSTAYLEYHSDTESAYGRGVITYVNIRDLELDVVSFSVNSWDEALRDKKLILIIPMR